MPRKYTADDRAIQEAEYAKRYDVVTYGSHGGSDPSKSYPNAKSERDSLAQLIPSAKRKELEAAVDKKYADQAKGAKREAMIPSYKKGGTVKKTGPAIVHKGERVIPAKKESATAKFIRMRNKKEGKY
jgi:hypothetical protein